jgi:hypothetical protein
MIYPNLSVQQMCQKYKGLKVYKKQCPKCNNEIVTDKPFITNDYAGFESSPCKECGFETGAFTFVTRTKESLNKWLGI